MSDYFRQNANISSFANAESWVILTGLEKQIKVKIEQLGVPLRNWNIRINFGIKTGYNEAFIIGEDKRRELIKENAKNAEIIRPILRGRDIKRYTTDFANIYLITTFPSLKIDIEQYPAVKDHLLSYGYDRLKQTGDIGARKKTNNKWFETQDSINYWEDFVSQKVVWKRVGSHLRFSFDESGFLALDSTCFATGEYIKYLTAILNSKVGRYLLKDSPQTGTGDLLVSVQAIEPLFIPQPSPDVNLKIEELVDLIILNQKDGKSYLKIEDELDLLIYKIFDFNIEEISLIEEFAS